MSVEPRTFRAAAAIFISIGLSSAVATLTGCGGTQALAPVNSTGIGMAQPSVSLLRRLVPNDRPIHLNVAHLQRTWLVPSASLKHHELLYVTQWTYGPVLIYDISGGKLNSKPVGQISATASDAAVDKQGNLYLSISNRIARYAPGKSKPTLYERLPWAGDAGAVAVTDDGTVYLAANTEIVVYERGRTKPSYTIANPLLDYANFLGIAVDASGNVYAPDVVDGSTPVYEFQAGSIYGQLLPIQSDWVAVFDEVDPQSNLILSNLGFTDIGGPEPPSIQVYHPGESQPFDVFDLNNYPGRIVLNHRANALFVQDFTGQKSVVDEYSYPSGQLIGTLSPKGGLTLPYGVAVSPRAPL